LNIRDELEVVDTSDIPSLTKICSEQESLLRSLAEEKAAFVRHLAILQEQNSTLMVELE
jgi:hypothetical protein